MNDDEAKALGLRAVTAGFIFGAGARVVWAGDPFIVVRFDEHMAYVVGAGRLVINVWKHVVWPDLRDAATMGAAIAQWQARPGHIYRTPCPVLSTVAACGLTSRQAITALVEALEEKQ